MSYSVVSKTKLREACLYTIETVRQHRKNYRENTITEKMEQWNKKRAQRWKWFQGEPWTREMVEEELRSRDSYGWPVYYNFHYMSFCYNSIGMDTACHLLRLIDSTNSLEVNLSTEDALHLTWPETDTDGDSI